MIMSFNFYGKNWTSLAELTDVNEDSIRHSCGPVAKSYIVFAAFRKSLLARSVASSDLGNLGSALVSKPSCPMLLVARKVLMVFADWRQVSARLSRSEDVVAMPGKIENSNRGKA